MSLLPRRLTAEQPDAERARWCVVRLDTMAPLDGEILAADVDSGVATMRRRAPDGSPVQVTYSPGPGGIAIIRR
jgi:hypothetical protein